jgi:hypothetical protein
MVSGTREKLGILSVLLVAGSVKLMINRRK